MVSQSLNNSDYQSQLQEKTAKLKHLLAPIAGSEEVSFDVYASATKHYRMRAEFRVWHTGDDLFYAMFEPGKKYDPIRIDQFAPASELINILMQPLLSIIKTNSLLKEKLFQIDFLTSQKGEALVSLLYHRALDDAWQVQAKILADTLKINIVGRARKQKLIIGQDSIMETLHISMSDNTSSPQTFYYQQVENAFTQPNAGVNEKMIAWVVAQSQKPVVGNNAAAKNDLLELYCGNGNFTLPLATGFESVLATEIAKSSVASAQHNARINGINNITIARLSSEEMTQALNGDRVFRRLQDVDLNSYNFACVFVDPPRAGLDTGTLTLIQKFDRIIYMSCNPDTLVDNLRHLQHTHQLQAMALFDQFPYTHHIECGVVLQRKG